MRTPSKRDRLFTPITLDGEFLEVFSLETFNFAIIYNINPTL